MSLILSVPRLKGLIKDWKILEEICIELQHDINVHRITENLAPLPNQWGYDIPAVPPAQAQTTNHKFSIPERSACVQLLPFNKCQCASLAMNTLEDAWKMLSVLCSVKVSSWAVTREERTGQKSAQTHLRPTCSRSHSLELLQDTSEPTFSSLDPLEIVLMGWNISEEDQKNSQQWYRVPISKMFSWQSTSVWMPDGLYPFWYFLSYHVTVNPLISHTVPFPAHRLILLHQNTI